MRIHFLLLFLLVAMLPICGTAQERSDWAGIFDEFDASGTIVSAVSLPGLYLRMFISFLQAESLTSNFFIKRNRIFARTGKPNPKESHSRPGVISRKIKLITTS